MIKQEFLQELVKPNDQAIWSYKWILIRSSMHQAPNSSINRTIDIWIKSKLIIKVRITISLSGKHLMPKTHSIQLLSWLTRQIEAHQTTKVNRLRKEKSQKPKRITIDSKLGRNKTMRPILAIGPMSTSRWSTTVSRMVTISNSKMILMIQPLWLVIRIHFFNRKLSFLKEKWTVEIRARINCHKLRAILNIWLIVVSYRLRVTDHLSSQEVCHKIRTNWNHSCRVSTTWTIIKTVMVGHQFHHTRHLKVAKAVLDMSHLDYKSIYNLTRKQCLKMKTKIWNNSNKIEH